MPFDFDAPVERAGTWSSRWERYAGRDVIALWVADADFRAPPCVLEAMAARLAHGVLGYTVPYAIGNILLTAWGPVIVALMSIGR